MSGLGTHAYLQYAFRIDNVSTCVFKSLAQDIGVSTDAMRNTYIVTFRMIAAHITNAEPRPVGMGVCLQLPRCIHVSTSSFEYLADICCQALHLPGNRMYFNNASFNAAQEEIMREAFTKLRLPLFDERTRNAALPVLRTSLPPELAALIGDFVAVRVRQEDIAAAFS